MYLMDCRMSLVAVQNAALLDGETVGVAMVSDERCIPLSVLIVVAKRPCHSGLKRDVRSIAKSATLNIESSQVSHLV